MLLSRELASAIEKPGMIACALQNLLICYGFQFHTKTTGASK